MQTTPPYDQACVTMALQRFTSSCGEDGEHRANVTALLIDGEPWFKGIEAAAALGYKKPRNAVNAHVDDEDKNAFEYLRGPVLGPLTNGNENATVYISESGLYSLIIRSKLPYAKAFQRWVLKDVLPTIRRTGGYTTQPAVGEPSEPIEI